MTKDQLIPKEEQTRIVEHIMGRIVYPKVSEKFEEMKALYKEAKEKYEKTEEYTKLKETLESLKEMELPGGVGIYVSTDNSWTFEGAKNDDFVEAVLERVATEMGEKNVGLTFESQMAIEKIEDELEARVGLLTIGNFDEIVKSLTKAVDIEGIIEEFVIDTKN